MKSFLCPAILALSAMAPFVGFATESATPNVEDVRGRFIAPDSLRDVPRVEISGIAVFARDSFMEQRGNTVSIVGEYPSEELGLTFNIVTDGAQLAILADDDFIFAKNIQNAELQTDEQ